MYEVVNVHITIFLFFLFSDSMPQITWNHKWSVQHFSEFIIFTTGGIFWKWKELRKKKLSSDCDQCPYFIDGSNIFSNNERLGLFDVKNYCKLHTASWILRDFFLLLMLTDVGEVWSSSSSRTSEAVDRLRFDISAAQTAICLAYLQNNESILDTN